MRSKILAWLAVIGLVTAVATPALAQVRWYNGSPPSFYWQNPDGSYPSYGDFSQALWGTPCGIECTRRAEIRWGMIPAHPHPHYRYYYYYPYPH